MRPTIHPCPPAGVIFDMDGVLCDTRMFHFQAFQELCLRSGRTLSEEEFRPLFGMGNGELIPKLFGDSIAPQFVREYADWKEARYRQLIGGRVEPMPGVRGLVHRLKGMGLPAAVASSAPRANVEQILEGAGLREFFQAVLAQEDVSRHKPDPEVFLAAADRLQLDPRTVWVLEDSHHGIQAGRAAGMTVLAVASTHEASQLSSADGVFSSVAEILELLESSVD